MVLVITICILLGNMNNHFRKSVITAASSAKEKNTQEQQPALAAAGAAAALNKCGNESRHVNGTVFHKVWPRHMDTHEVWSHHYPARSNASSPYWHSWNFSKVCAAQGNLGGSLYAPPRYQSEDRPSGLRIVMIGDSLMRYHFVMMIHYLHTGHWIHDSMQPNLLREASLGGNGGWPAFYRALERYFENDSLVCDCYRGSNWTKSLFENQYYLDQQCLDNSIYFFSKFGTYGLRGYHNASEINAWSHSTEKNGTKLILPKSVYEQGNFRWRYMEYEPFLRNVVALLEPRPRIVIINEGLWPGGPENLSNETVVRQIQETIHDLGMVSVYKTTTTKSKNSNPGLVGHDELCCQIFDHCLRMDWTACVPENEYWDNLHFLAYPNLRFTEQLLDLLEKIDIIPTV